MTSHRAAWFAAGWIGGVAVVVSAAAGIYAAAYRSIWRTDR